MTTGSFYRSARQSPRAIKSGTSRRSLTVALVAVAAAGLAACSSSGTSGSATSDGANSAPSSQGSTAAGGSALKLAYFSVGSSNTYVQAGIQAAQQAAAAAGAQLHVYDGAFSATTQSNQLQEALGGNYNGFIIEPDDGNVICSLVKQALAKKIVVAAINGTLCGATSVMPGTAAFVSGQTLAAYKKYLADIAKRNPSGGDMAVMTGPTLSPNTLTMKKALAWFTSTYSSFHVVSNQPGDYTTPTAVKIATSVFTANPHLKIYLSNYAEMTLGIVQAAKQAGVSGTEIFDMGADKPVVQLIKSGQITESLAFLPIQEAKFGVQAVIDQLKGKPHPKFYDLTQVGRPALPGTPFITKANAGSFTPEY